ncbi:excinuclease ABC subunit UvrC [Rarobacter incanus]|uniref:UvrABC system protein C n=1 Tax=Rarobacter incanus TaxID=153494 RepID=A0A542SM67_9MICO|nr:excinuclease ABC subunit UvrC [Rarobacter incanus]TQK75726.1 excinuclease ABC subunit C [Rarobacter incanus]
MTDPATYRPAPGEIPASPGVYRFRDPDGRVIYVGKAKNLRARLANYFQPLHSLHRRTQQMVTTAASVEWTVVGTEVESLALEYQWIKEYDPRFNIKYRDDKSYPYLAITMRDEFPRALVTRTPKKAGNRYFGPYGQAWAIRETLDLLLKPFPVRTCSTGVFKRAGLQGRPCLLGYIDKCAAPCVGRISAEDHRKLAEELCDFMAGKTAPITRRLEAEMQQAAQRLDFEAAARLRDNLQALRTAMEKNAVVLSDGMDADVYAMTRDELEASVQVFYVRQGRIRGQRGWIVEIGEPAEDGELVDSIIEKAYGEYTQPGLEWDRKDAIPATILVPVAPKRADALQEWLTGMRGSKVRIQVPQRGEKAEFARTVLKNAEHAMQLHRMRRAGDLTSRSLALSALQDALGMDQAPLRIECYDISHTQGTNQMASMVVFEDGLARKSEYRTFAIRGSDGQGARDDTEAMREVLRRRFKHIQDSDEAPPNSIPAGQQGAVSVGEPGGGAIRSADGGGGFAGGPGGRTDGAVGDPRGEGGLESGSARGEGGLEAGAVRGKGGLESGAVRGEGGLESGPARDEHGRPRRFAYPPQLVVVDGGQPQVEAAREVFEELGLTHITLCGLAKRLEEVWMPGEDYPLIFERTSPGLYLMQQVRDEAHRFAIKAHRSRRSASMTRSELDGVPGIGPTKAKALLKKFGSLSKLRAASVDEVAAVPGMGAKSAAALLAALNS